MTGGAELYATAWAAPRAGRAAEAERVGRAALAADTGSADGWFLLGAACHSQGRLAEAADCYTRAARLRPERSEIHYNLGIAFGQLGRPAEAENCFRHALKLRPDDPEARINLGNALQDQGRPAEAAECFQQVLARWPDRPEVHYNLGNALCDLGRFDEAAACFGEALRLRPNFPEVHNNLGAALRNLGRLGQAEECLRQALALRPEYPEALNNLGLTLCGQGRIDEAAAGFRRALEQRPGYHRAHDGLLMLLHYRPGVTPAELATAHADYDRRHAAPLRTTWRPHGHDRDPERPLRLGLVSADFYCHPVGFLLIRAAEALARRPGVLLCYSDRLTLPDNMTARFRAAAAVWRDTAGLTDEALAEQVRADAVDVLIDLAGHTAGNRLLVFARRPAPVQCTWLGYVGTTGLEAMDYLIADEQQVPSGAEGHHREKVLRLPSGYATYDPPSDAPEPGPPPALANGRVTFGCFNNPAKLSAPTVAAFAAVLRRVPGSRLILKYRGLDDSAASQRLRELFAAAGIEPERVELRGGTAALHLAAYRDIDVALDSFPYSGGVTTCDALWMGVPVVTLPGDTFASRHGLSHLSSVGFAELAARDLDDYVARAADLAADLGRLAELRAGLRERVARSPLCDGERLADELLAALRGAWRAWVAGGAP